MKNKKGQLVTNLIYGVGSLIIGVIVTLVVVSTLINSGILGSSAGENTTAISLTDNFSTGILAVGHKIPVILTIAAVVIIFGVLVFLVANAKRMGIGGGGGL